jgi:UDP:flavonoid glycosyltransferase YjiC (YdhE family)
MHAILANVGTGGDVFPYVGLGVRLRARGHRVTLAVNAPFRKLAEAHDLEFCSLVSESDTEAFLSHPDLWHPYRSALFLSRWATPLIQAQYAALVELAADPDTVLIASPAIFAARFVQEKLGRPLVSVILQPWLLQSVHVPPILPGLPLPSWAPRPIGHLYWRLVDFVGDRLIGRPFNQIRVRLGLRPVRQLFRWWLSPSLVLGLFPDWYAPAQPDWPPQVHLTGFPMFDGGTTGLPKDVAEFCAAGTPPVAFTFGTGMRHGTRVFGAAIEACRLLGVRGLLLTRYAHQLPAPLPASVRHVSFAPFAELFPRCAAVVHHGGIGTTGRALTAGTPQLVMPHAYDQIDNATRVQRLGAGSWLRPRHFTGAHLARALTELMQDPVRQRCQAIAARAGCADAYDIAVGWLENLADRELAWQASTQPQVSP